jgi:hypothetical protein
MSSKWRCVACGCTDSDCECLDDDSMPNGDFQRCEQPEEDFIDAGSVLDIEYDR